MNELGGRPTTAAAVWRPTASHLRASVISVVLATAAVALGRPDLLVLSVPLLVIAGWSAARRPRESPTFRVAIDHDTVREGEATTWHAGAEGDGIDRVAAALAPAPVWRLRPGSGASVDVGDDDGSGAAVAIVVGAARWGRRGVGPGAIAVESAWAGFRSGPVKLDSPTLMSLPLPAMFDNTAAVPDPHGLVGSHRSRRQGDGAEFASIRPFAVGDRLRRIHWPVSLRTGELHVSASHVDVDTQVLLVIDASTDAGERGPFDGQASSLDRAVRAAGAIAEHFLQRGDRVGARTIGATRSLRMPVGTGRPYLRRLLHELALVEAGGGRERHARPRPLGVEPGGLVIVLTPLLSRAALEQTVYLAHRHPIVLVVDTLPDDIARQATEAAYRLAWRVRLLERATDIARLQHEGVPVVPWKGPGSLDVILRDLGRRAGAPRLVVR